MSVSVWLAFLAGLASFLSPCVLSLMPAYIGYLGGRSVYGKQIQNSTNRLNTFLHGLAFVAGFSLVFVGLGLAASAIGSLLYGMRVWMARLGGIIIVLFGLHMIGLIHIPWLDYDLRPENRVEEKRSYLSSFFLGILFSAGWSPCVGPVLSAILTLAVNEGSLLEGVKLLSAYSIGFAIPFLITALGIGWISSRLHLIGKFTRAIEITMGTILIVVGVLLFLGIYEQIAQFSPVINTGL